MKGSSLKVSPFYSISRVVNHRIERKTKSDDERINTFVPIDFLEIIIYTGGKETTMPEKRRVPRKKFESYMRVLDDDTEATVGHLVEVSPTGLRLETSEPVPPGREFHVHMELTPDVSDRLFMFVSIRSRWCKPDTIMPNLYRVGFEITNITPHDHEIYQRLLDLYGQ
jgi:hypothetical protein